MKTAEELLKEKRITPETIHHNYDYVYRTVCEVIESSREQLKRETITVISDDGFILPDQTLTQYREKLKLIIDVL